MRKEYLIYRLLKIAGNIIEDVKKLLPKLEKNERLVGDIDVVKHLLDRGDKTAEQIANTVRHHYNTIMNPANDADKIHFNYDKNKGVFRVSAFNSPRSSFVGQRGYFEVGPIEGPKTAAKEKKPFPWGLVGLGALGTTGAGLSAAGLYQRHKLHQKHGFYKKNGKWMRRKSG